MTWEWAHGSLAPLTSQLTPVAQVSAASIPSLVAFCADGGGGDSGSAQHSRVVVAGFRLLELGSFP